MKPTVERVDDRADAEPLAQRDPGEEHDEADEHHDSAERESGDVGEALVEHVPRREPELGVEDRRDADAEDEDPGEQARQAATRAPARSAT